MGRGVLLAGLSVVVLTACGRVDRDLSGTPTYASMIGRQFRTKMELVVYTLKGERKMLAIRRAGYGSTVPDRDQIRPPFPIRYYDTIVLGVLPAGTEFRVVKVKEQGSTGMSFTRLYVEITRCPDPEWLGKIVYPSGMTDYDTAHPVPVFDPKYVEELPGK